ncbi:MAG: hypothetical protein ABI818_02865 [Acidobacteriota bacterium]
MLLVRQVAGLVAAVTVATAAAASAQAPPPPQEMTCTAIVLPAVEGIAGDSAAVASSVRSLFVSYLTGPSMKAVELDARLVSQALEEAKLKDCPRVLTVSLVRKQNGGGHALAGAVGRAAGTAAWYIPGGGAVGTAAIRGAAAGAEAVGYAASSTRAKDEIRIEYRVTSTDGATILPVKSDKAKAKSDGEDLLTPLVARASEVIAAAVGKK